MSKPHTLILRWLRHIVVFKISTPEKLAILFLYWVQLHLLQEVIITYSTPCVMWNLSISFYYQTSKYDNLFWLSQCVRANITLECTICLFQDKWKSSQFNFYMQCDFRFVLWITRIAYLNIKLPKHLRYVYSF